MGKKQKPEELEVGSGLVLVDKPAGLTSHDVVGRIRKLAGTRKVGHAGTLDPMATGVLVVGINRATRLLTHIVGVDKTYTATVRLGQSTSTDDAEGEVLQTRFANAVTPEAIAAEIAKLTGAIQQVPATVSAIKVDGQRAHARARAGEEVALKSRDVTVHDFEVFEIRRIDGGKLVDVDIEVRVSSGTYVRALARDLGEALEVGGHLTALRRTAVGSYSIDQTLTLDQLGEDFGYIGLAEAAEHLFPARQLTAEETENLGYGRRITASGTGEDPQLTAAFDPDGELVALLIDVPAKKGASASPDAAHAADSDSIDYQAKPELVFAISTGPGSADSASADSGSQTAGTGARPAGTGVTQPPGASE
ncbi:tRNA pseudouridine(55) synthase TruB [Nesterenkonia sp. DZ6]|uniref:tRNA pseudouridine(55) synthase TruB n=1 Tax=Nesterenkonia sp. DZ6 TaxID=2901229 RepID=UPI001F4CD148|nr:tRNA pseudouridine(55) synthase TruB [Nesterenkonia sp. DZ6]MCH8559714.1 tRNA pseudouridine(55) synthase TruB [Nesterenkonia sp. DZ6]